MTFQEGWFEIHYSQLNASAFWLKCINLPKCTKVCSIRKLEVDDKNFGLVTKNSHALANIGA